MNPHISPRSGARRICRVTLLAALAGLALPPLAAAAPARPGEIVVRTQTAHGVHSRVERVRPGTAVQRAMRALRRRPGVVSATPNVLARASGPFIPDDPGLTGRPAGWEASQWNFAAVTGVNAPDAWANLIAAGRPGGQGTIVAVIDSGVAYRTAGPYLLSPDFAAGQFVRGHDFIGEDSRPNDASGHGTHVAATIAERTDNGVGLTGLAYGARIMPVRVLDSEGFGDVDDIARGVRYAVRRGADVINLSMEFDSNIVAEDIPSLIDALDDAADAGVTVVAAAGNEGAGRVPFPAASPNVIAVGATTIHRCLAKYSNFGREIDVVAPGGGPDARLADAGCAPDAPAGPDVLQMTFDGTPRRFGFPTGYQGTSMAAPHVAATAALVIASGRLGTDPTPRQLRNHLRHTASDLGPPGIDPRYGAGLINAERATRAKGAPAPPRRPPPAPAPIPAPASPSPDPTGAQGVAGGTTPTPPR